MKSLSHGTKIKVGLSNVGSSSSSNRADSSSTVSKSRPLVLDTPCSGMTIYDLCETKNDPSFHKKRKTRSKDSKDIKKESNILDEPVVGKIEPKPSTTVDKSVTENSSSAPVGPQVEIVNGKIVLRESSLMVPVHGAVSHEDFEEVEEDIHPTAKYSSFTKHLHSYAWGIEETKQFYEALRQCGTDFSLMQAFFPHRTRKQLKLKFMREEKQHPALIKATLTSQLPLDLTPFEVHLGKIDHDNIDDALTVRASKRKIEGNEEIDPNADDQSSKKAVRAQQMSSEISPSSQLVDV